MAVSTLKTDELDAIIRALKNPPRARVGILGSSDSRNKGTSTNADIGAKHELGEDGLPIRSFLRMPLTNHLQKTLEKAGFFQRDLPEQISRSGSLKSLVEKIGIAGKDTVLEAFKTGGFGEWAPWAIPGYTNNTGQILVDTQQLRDSITTDVVDGPRS